MSDRIGTSALSGSDDAARLGVPGEREPPTGPVRGADGPPAERTLLYGPSGRRPLPADRSVGAAARSGEVGALGETCTPTRSPRR